MGDNETTKMTERERILALRYLETMLDIKVLEELKVNSIEDIKNLNIKSNLLNKTGEL